jgi:hypothetical protein
MGIDLGLKAHKSIKKQGKALPQTGIFSPSIVTSNQLPPKSLIGKAILKR